MIYSMTAFGRVQKEESGYCVTVEVKTINSRNLDLVLRFPKNYMDLEQSARKQVARFIRRGRVEVYAQIETILTAQNIPRINRLLAYAYWEQLQDLHRCLPGSDPPVLEHLLKFPNLFEPEEEPEDREVVDRLLTSSLEEVLRQVQEMRAQEGNFLLEDCLERLATLREELSLIETRKDLVLEEYEQRLHKRIQELLKDKDMELDENRFLQEVAFLAERSDITEEIVRLQSHLDQIRTSLSDGEAVEGRKLDFLIQELHREVNTIGSKACDLDIAQSVVKMKSEIGKLREQIQNIE